MKIVGILLAVLGVAAIIAAPEVMNSSEVNTLRGIGAGAAVLGAILAATARKK